MTADTTAMPTDVVHVVAEPHEVAGLVVLALSADPTAAVHVMCLGVPDPATAQALTGCGAMSVVVLAAGAPVPSPGLDRPEDYVPAVAERLAGATPGLVLVPATVSGWEIAARLATRLGCGLVSEATSVRRLPDGGWCAERTLYAGAAVQGLEWHGRAVVSAAAGRGGPGALPPPDAGGAGSGGPVALETVVVDRDTRVRVTSRTSRERDAVDLSAASRVVCVGMGVQTLDDLALVEDLARALGAELACTRPVAEDRGWLPVDRYIGISGASVHPDLYVGVGVSGQVQHTVGIRDARTVVAINTDASAALMGQCDHGLVGDLRELVPLLAGAVRAAGVPS
ncbi:electron transfer flavoprotein subunit alpha/FixB family protein [Actinotalea subterranea]|uniref:electron transfer flavoprotein subunit alpha/FixB family protein n=1 Tax=Actinotalea subterranea TaxID=2607497 RepID=UPI0011EC7EB8|nr:electron transfer flavoprotein subunit alpha/FixB family protein [Actinotalea subterranea]